MGEAAAVDEYSKAAVVKQIFGDNNVGEVEDDFQCALDALSVAKQTMYGRLFVTTRALLFYSNLYGVENKVNLPYVNITSCSKTKLSLFNYGISVQTALEQSYVFRKLADVDGVLAKLQAAVKASRPWNQPQHSVASSSNESDFTGTDYSDSATSTAQSTTVESPSSKMKTVTKSQRESKKKGGSLQAPDNSAGSKAALVGAADDLKIRSMSLDSNDVAYGSPRSSSAGRTRHPHGAGEKERRAAVAAQQRAASLAASYSRSGYVAHAHAKKKASSIANANTNANANATEDGTAHGESGPDRGLHESRQGKQRTASAGENAYTVVDSPTLKGTGAPEDEPVPGARSEGVDDSSAGISTPSVPGAGGDVPTATGDANPNPKDGPSAIGTRLFKDRYSNTVLVDSPEEFEAECSAARRKVAVMDASPFPHMQCVEHYIQNYIQDNALSSLNKFHVQSGDLEVNITPWSNTVPAQDNQECVVKLHAKYRVMSFLKIVNIPGLKSTRGAKSQTWRNFCLRSGELVGFIMNSSTRMFEVPSADCFTVAESYIVRKVGAEVQLSIYVEVVWSKSSMLKWAIDSSTATETTKFLCAFADDMKKSHNPFISTSDAGGGAALTLTGDGSSDPTAVDPLVAERKARIRLETKAIEAIESLTTANKEIVQLLKTQSKHLVIIEVALPIILIAILSFFLYQQSQLTSMIVGFREEVAYCQKIGV